MRADAAMRASHAASTALGRVGDPDDIGDAIAAVVGEGMRWVTGQRIEVSRCALL